MSGPRNELVVGAFYWVWPVNDPDAGPGEEWTNEIQPARYVGLRDGEPRWHYIGEDDESEWPVRWIGPRIEPPATRAALRAGQE